MKYIIEMQSSGDFSPHSNK